MDGAPAAPPSPCDIDAALVDGEQEVSDCDPATAAAIRCVVYELARGTPAAGIAAALVAQPPPEG